MLGYYNTHCRYLVELSEFARDRMQNTGLENDACIHYNYVFMRKHVHVDDLCLFFYMGIYEL